MTTSHVDVAIQQANEASAQFKDYCERVRSECLLAIARECFGCSVEEDREWLLRGVEHTLTSEEMQAIRAQMKQLLTLEEKAATRDACNKRHRSALQAFEQFRDEYQAKLRELGQEVNESRVACSGADSAQGNLGALQKEHPALWEALDQVRPK